MNYELTKWTPDQERVINSEAGRLICSAAAGSGKTAVMIERIVRLIRKGADPFSFLVITFTNAAAAEMKEKIRKRLTEERKDPVIAAAAEKAGAMEVCTIHAFCQHLIRQEFQIVGVDPFFQICTGAQREKLFADAFRQACNELKNREDPDYRTFIRRYEPAAARDIVAEVWNFIMSLPEPFGWLEEKTESVPLDLDRNHPWFRTVSRMTEEKIRAMQVILRRQAEMFDEYEKLDACREVWKADCALVDAFSRWKDGEEVNPEKLEGGFVRFPVLRNLNDREIAWKEQYKEQREQLKGLVTSVLAWMHPEREQMSKEFSEIRNSLRGLRKLTEETDLAYQRNKARVCALDFTDLEHKALQILQDEGGRAAVRSRYRRIFVDECQDISSVQDALIQELAGEGNTLFMVGDVKQSIYRFRLANPNLFSRRIENRERDGNECIFLQENFRSRPEILETVNTVFRDVMRETVADIRYEPRDELKPGLVFEGSEPVNVDLVEAGEGMTRLEAAAAHTARRIRELTDSGRFRLSDIVILMPEVSTDGPKLADLLKAQGIDVFFDGRGGFFDRPEVEVFRNLLMLLDNPHLDLPLLTVLVNPPFAFIEEELSLIRLKNMGRGVPFWQAFNTAAEEDSPLGRKCRAAKERIEGWRFQAVRTHLNDFLWYLLEDSGIYAIFGAQPDGNAAQKNLRSFCLQADRAAETGVCCLREYLDYLSEQASGGEMQAAASLGDQDNLVRIMTMHKSKGLQFPVVFCLGLEKGLKGKAGGQVRLDEELGLCLRYKVPEWRLARRTAADEIFEWKKNHDVKAERICLLYVAMTRAQQKLFMVGAPEEIRPLWDFPSGDHRTLAASDYLDCVMPALWDEEKKSTTFTQGSKPWKITIIDCIQQENVDNRKVIHSLRPWVETLLSAPAVDDLWKTDPAEKERERTENSLKKYSVSTLLRDARNRVFLEDEEQTPEEKRTPDYVERAMRRFRAGSRPAFMEPAKEADGAARGTVIHRFLSLVDLDAVRKPGGADSGALAVLRDRLVEEQVFTEEEGAWIRPEAAAKFFASEIGRRMLASPEIHREWDFNLYLKERGMILQGMIDCAFLEGDGWILLDYKTDRIRDELAFTEAYRPQLEWYAVALRELTGRPVKESWLYALSVDKAIRTDRP